MKPKELNLTIKELDELCRLYMDCRLSVMEEKELEYILSHTALTSPAIDEVKALMNIQLLPQSSRLTPGKRRWNWRYISGIAASVAVLVSVALFFSAPEKSNPPENESGVYIAAYSNGERLSGNDAVTATSIAMAKADSLMNYAALAEHEYMRKADDIITGTFNNLTRAL